MANELFKKYYSRLAKEGFIKALVCGLIVGFSVLLLSATVSLIVGFKGFWVSLLLLAASAGIATPIFYYKRFRPSTKAIAQRVDELGLEERLLTMLELKNDTSYIAMKQREDAQAALKTVNARLVKIAVSVPLVVTLAVVAVFGTGMTIVSALPAAASVPEQYVVSYIAKEGGELQEETSKAGKQTKAVTAVRAAAETKVSKNISQTVEEGEDAVAVLAVPNDGWMFVSWSDGWRNPYRVDVAVSGNLTVTAVFEKIEEDDGEAEKEDSGKNKPEDPPSNGGVGPGAGNETDEKFDQNNQIIDGNTYYGDQVYENAYDDAMNELSQDDDIPDELKDIIGDYYDTIEK